MIATIRKSDNRVIESQSHGTADVMLKNAISAGLTQDEVEIREVTPQELTSMLEAQAAEDKIAFEKTPDGIKALLSASDGTMIRIIEDLYSQVQTLKALCVAKSLFTAEEAPAIAATAEEVAVIETKIAARKALRAKLK